MRNHFRRQYVKPREEMKKELRVMMENNIALQLLVRDVMLLHKARSLEYEVWHILGTKHYDIYKNEFCGIGGLVGKSMTGRYDEFFDTMNFIDKEFTKKYRNIIPDRLAIGDAYGVAIGIWKRNKHK